MDYGPNRGDRLDDIAKVLQILHYCLYVFPATIIIWPHIFNVNGGWLLFVVSFAIGTVLVAGYISRLLSSVPPRKVEKILLAVGSVAVSGLLLYSLSLLTTGRSKPEMPAQQPSTNVVVSPSNGHLRPETPAQQSSVSVSITITQAPPPGRGGENEMDVIGGSVRGVSNLTEVRVVIYTITDKWYVQPWYDSPYTKINNDGSWRTRIHLGSEYMALLVTSSYRPKRTIISAGDEPQVGGDVLAIARAVP